MEMENLKIISQINISTPKTYYGKLQPQKIFPLKNGFLIYNTNAIIIYQKFFR